MDDEDIPKISGDKAGEACSVVLVFISLMAAFYSLAVLGVDFAWGFGFLSVSAGLAAIAFAILAVGRKISSTN